MTSPKQNTPTGLGVFAALARTPPAPAAPSNTNSSPRTRRKAQTYAEAFAESSLGAVPAMPALDLTMPIAAYRAGQFVQLLREHAVETRPPAEPREVLTVAEAADLLRVSTATLWRLERSGAVRSHTVSKSRRFLRSELIAFVRAS